MLSRGEQRALLLLSLLLIVSLACRILVGMIPDREPPGMEEFIRESRMVMAAMVRADSLQHIKEDSIRLRKEAFGQSSSGYPARRNTPPRYSAARNTPPRQAYAGPIDLNRADSVQLLPLPGIGPVFAGRIIKYRNLLGGYASIDQLKEVYGMKEETLDLIRGRIRIDTSIIRRLDLNEATFRELLRHPYLEYEEVKALVEYRDFKKTISSPKELILNHILPDTTLSKMDGYFDFR